MAAWKYFDCDVMIGTSQTPIPDEMPDASALLRQMDRYGIERALMYSRDGVNARGAAEATKSDRLALCWVLSLVLSGPRDNIEDQVDRMMQAGAKAARFVVTGVGPNDPPVIIKPFLLGKLYDKLQQHRMPLLVDARPLYGPIGMARYGLEDIDAICGEFPGIPIILLGPHRSLETQLVLMMRKHGSLYCSHTFMTLYGQLEQSVAKMGADRILYGSQVPYADPSLPIGMLNYAEIPTEQKIQIAGGNLRSFIDRVR